MSEQEQQQEGQKTVVAFVAGLLIGGLLVWVFSGDAASSPVDTNTENDSEMVDESNDAADNETADSSTAVSDTEDASSSTNQPAMTVGAGDLNVSDQPAGTVVTIKSATFPTDDGWIAVRSYTNGYLGNILGAARYSKSQGLVPEQVELLAATRAGSEYAVVFFTENGDRNFDLSTDTQIEGGMDTFTAL